MKEIILHCEDKYIPMERKDTKKTILMKKIATSQFHDYYEAQLQMHLICLRYYFEFTDTQGEKYIMAIMSFIRNASQTGTECLIARRISGKRKCLRCRTGQQIRSCTRSFLPFCSITAGRQGTMV